MEPYWQKTLTVSDKNYDISLYQYSPKSIALVSGETFGKMFAHKFKEIGGKFNPRLSVGAGWIFKLDAQKDLTLLIKNIYTGKEEPKTISIVPPNIDEKDTDIRIFNCLTELVASIPEEETERILQENDESKTTIYYNREENTLTEGDMIYMFTSAHKKVEIYQLKLT
jgi:hypothetical protein